MRSFMQAIVGIFFLILSKVFGRLKIEGKDNIRNLKGPVIIVANHKSHFDPPMLSIALLNNISLLPMRFASKDSLFLIPFFNVLIWLLGAFRLHRGKGLAKSLEHPQMILKKGGTIVMFPEGKIVPDRSVLGQGKAGAALLAFTTSAPLLPIALIIEPKMSWWRFLTSRPPITIRIGAPFYLTKTAYLIEEISKDQTDQATRMLMSKIAQLYFAK